jgi:hypothetical protein
MALVWSGAHGARADDLGAIPWGASEAVVRARVEPDACVQGRMASERVCSAAWGVTGAGGRAYFWIAGDRLVRVNLIVPSRSFSDLVQAIDAWLASAGISRIERMTRGAVTFSNEIREWRTTPVAATVWKYDFGYGGETQASLWLVDAPPASSLGHPTRLRAR